ncbi:DUF1918 domain-containing protein [Kitasatospora herbaricolor]|uniref:DUF1918 domain-containing protein n=1 Tax=Kitasatospora herbaricolor TaxID=68217 RepID=UPI0036DDA7A6
MQKRDLTNLWPAVVRSESCRTVGNLDRVVEVVEVLGPDGTPPYRVRAENGHETIMSPGPDTVVDRRKTTDTA